MLWVTVKGVHVKHKYSIPQKCQYCERSGCLDFSPGPVTKHNGKMGKRGLITIMLPVTCSFISNDCL